MTAQQQDKLQKSCQEVVRFLSRSFERNHEYSLLFRIFFITQVVPLEHLICDVILPESLAFIEESSIIGTHGLGDLDYTNALFDLTV